VRALKRTEGERRNVASGARQPRRAPPYRFRLGSRFDQPGKPPAIADTADSTDVNGEPAPPYYFRLASRFDRFLLCFRFGRFTGIGIGISASHPYVGISVSPKQKE
jgi:hypothetical protein